MHRLKAVALALSVALPTAPALALPAAVSQAVKSPTRPAEAVALDASRRPVEVLRFLNLERNDRVLDLFAGSGYYSEIMADAVGENGSVVAWQPENFFDDKEKASWDALRARAPRVRLMVSPVNDMRFERASFDFVLMHLTYHDFYWESAQYNYPRVNPDAVLREVYAAMKPGAVVGVVDHVADPGGDTRAKVDRLHRIDPSVIRADFERAGFRFVRESDMLRNTSDDHGREVFDPAVRGRTDRVVYLFRKQGG